VRIGSDEMWDRAEGRCARARATGLDYELKEGDGAFYGPKIDFDVDRRHRPDLAARHDPARLRRARALRPRVTSGEDNQEHRPVVIHRAIFGSFERFIAILIEHFAGAFPLWLAPSRCACCRSPTSSRERARASSEQLRAAGIRAELDDRNETLNYKIREAETQKVPYMADRRGAAITEDPRARSPCGGAGQGRSRT
jgi:threonyl-tRNA synthetase